MTIFPKGPFPILPPVVFLARPFCYQLHCLGDNLPLPAVLDKKVNMVRSHRIIQDTRAETLLPLEKPLQPPSPVSGKPQKELLLMASMGDVPHAARNVMSVSSGHPGILVPPEKGHFNPENALLTLKTPPLFQPSFINSTT